jgi:hypothetical protein
MRFLPRAPLMGVLCVAFAIASVCISRTLVAQCPDMGAFKGYCSPWVTCNDFPTFPCSSNSQSTPTYNYWFSLPQSNTYVFAGATISCSTNYATCEMGLGGCVPSGNPTYPPAVLFAEDDCY